jgi:disease resistance protein RPM1
LVKKFVSLDRYKVDTITATNNRTLVDPRLRAFYTNVTDLVGIGDAKEEVITRLTMGDDEHKKRIVSIAGFGGLGKTTLAKAVYNDIGGQFGCKAFVSVSRNPDVKKIFKDILYELDKEKFKEIHSTMLGDKHLIDEVIEFIQNKRYVLNVLAILSCVSGLWRE